MEMINVRIKKVAWLFMMILLIFCFGIKGIISPKIVDIVDEELIYEVNYLKDIKEEYNNEDIVGIINIVGTEMQEIVLQGEDNEFYLNHNINKKFDIKGSIYLDYRVKIDDSKKKIVYGHNSKNLKVPFKILDNYYDYDFYKDHEYIELITDKEIQKYQIFSVFVETKDWDYMKINFNNDEWYEHLVKLKSKSLYETNVKVDQDDEILILQTCCLAKEYKQYKNKYLLIIAKRI